jgi:hypothetical protein
MNNTVQAAVENYTRIIPVFSPIKADRVLFWVLPFHGKQAAIGASLIITILLVNTELYILFWVLTFHGKQAAAIGASLSLQY